ncbi:hypothetical protein [Caulobacter vibrioides]|uniref:Uncharacterized protein n=2 Tax=Caulobacter vibrioides TaxID=155892 RepID=Q9A4R2_CAUVC|nr:hypothetical protein [Caulobacter vibrioides]YP_002518229.1 hypothetical protein CCNA_02856 [Caulobacter vibrioides NA1000]AAK24732.1 hypothetical protein CC_2768 [Caulobacter vibrioides CB15]ACL96321.1 hypothetical protein CCNA_02856 [Caulobacter vibrioides NA1000]ATC29605.1 hypothetical protein CA607_14945 [Caulobacter vibrioides]QXZ51125.1 hypothetical protein KZH45_14705 [Caulobacter vibrioides]
MVVLMLCAALLVIVGCPETALGKGLRRWLVDWPAKVLAGLTPARLVLLLALLAVSTLVVVLFEVEGAILLGMALPEVAVWFMAFDVAVFIDLFAAIALAANGARLKGLGDRIKALPRRFGRGLVARVRRSGQGRQGGRRFRRPGSGATKSEDGDAGWSGAAQPGALAWA